MSRAGQTPRWADMTDENSLKVALAILQSTLFYSLPFPVAGLPMELENFCYNYTRAFCRLTVSTPAQASIRCISVFIVFGGRALCLPFFFLPYSRRWGT